MNAPRLRTQSSLPGDNARVNYSPQQFLQHPLQRLLTATEALNHRFQERPGLDALDVDRVAGLMGQQQHERLLRAAVAIPKWIISGGWTFRVTDDGQTAEAPFFDIEDEHFVKIDLWITSRAPITLMNFFYEVAHDVAAQGRPVIRFRSDFSNVLQGLAAENKTLQDELTGSDRLKAAMEKRQPEKQKWLPSQIMPSVDNRWRTTVANRYITC